MRKTADISAEQISFGIELETIVPSSCLAVGGYHHGAPVVNVKMLDGTSATAPSFNGRRWRADRDGSISVAAGKQACEFVSPILNGSAGVTHLIEMVEFINRAGAEVNASCGCHITVGIASVIGSSDHVKVSEFLQKLAHISQWHARSLYGQTGSGRHLNNYSKSFAPEVARHMKRIVRTSDVALKQAAAESCGRGYLNFKKAFTVGVVEFRVFAGTVNASKILHHLATVLGLCRRAAEVKCLGGFKKNKLQEERTRTAVDALTFLWDFLGWQGSARPVALGLLPALHSRFDSFKPVAMRMCAKFDQSFPTADL